MKFSNKFMEKFGNLVFSRKNELFQKRLLPTNFNLFSYLIDWKTRKRVHLVNWLKGQVNDSFGDQLVIDNGWHLMKPDVAIVSIQKWVINNYSYVGDEVTWDCKEKWATFKESFIQMRGLGDCEDYAIAILVLARKSGIPSDRIKLVAGMVRGGGHAYILYTTETGREVIIDGTYWPDIRSVNQRKTIWQQPNYYYGNQIWFGVNDSVGYIKR